MELQHKFWKGVVSETEECIKKGGVFEDCFSKAHEKYWLRDGEKTFPEQWKNINKLKVDTDLEMKKKPDKLFTK